jgi:hypothetical protein
MSAYGRLLSVAQLELDAIECPQQEKADHRLAGPIQYCLYDPTPAIATGLCLYKARASGNSWDIRKFAEYLQNRR